MSTTSTLILGAIAGLTILLGLPVGRLRPPAPGVRALLNATAVGVLLFLLWDVLSHAVEPVESALNAAATEHTGSWARFAGLAAVFAVGLSVGLLSLVAYERWMGARAHRRVAAERFGPGAAAVAELRARGRLDLASPAPRLALLIAVGIGLHNFSEGLAIGQSSAKGAISLALMLAVGFGLHNATEGFGIVAPLAATGNRPSWGFLGLMGLIAGGPTFLGTLIGRSFVNEAVFIAFLALAAGSILYVIVQLLGVSQKIGRKEMAMFGLLLGLLAGFATDFFLGVAGG